MDVRSFENAVLALGIHLGQAQIQAFCDFEEALYSANLVMNLTRVPRDECWTRHFVDSLLFEDMVPKDSAVLDIGTGPGFPAWPLACAREDLQVTAMDSNGKMLGFLSSQPLPNLTVINGRAEEMPKAELYDFVTGRAVAPLAVQLEISSRLCRVGGVVAPMRSSGEVDQLEATDLRPLGLMLESHSLRRLPATDVERLFPVYRKVQPTSKGYPRRWADIKRKPLG